jgi:hypothetical protein
MHAWMQVTTPGALPGLPAFKSPAAEAAPADSVDAAQWGKRGASNNNGGGGGGGGGGDGQWGVSGGAAFLGGVSAGGEPVMMGALPTAAAFLSNPPGGGIMGGWGVQGAGGGFGGFGMGLGGVGAAAYGNQQAPAEVTAAAGGGEEGDGTRGPGRGGRAPRGAAKKELVPKATATAKAEEQRKVGSAPPPPAAGGRQRKEGSPPGLSGSRASRGGRNSEAELSAFDGGDGGDEFIGASAKKVREIRIFSLPRWWCVLSAVCAACVRSTHWSCCRSPRTSPTSTADAGAERRRTVMRGGLEIGRLEEVGLTHWEHSWVERMMQAAAESKRETSRHAFAAAEGVGGAGSGGGGGAGSNVKPVGERDVAASDAAASAAALGWGAPPVVDLLPATLEASPLDKKEQQRGVKGGGVKGGKAAGRKGEVDGRLADVSLPDSLVGDAANPNSNGGADGAGSSRAGAHPHHPPAGPPPGMLHAHAGGPMHQMYMGQPPFIPMPGFPPPLGAFQQHAPSVRGGVAAALMAYLWVQPHRELRFHGLGLNAGKPNRLFGVSRGSWQSCPSRTHTSLSSPPFSLSTPHHGGTCC